MRSCYVSFNFGNDETHVVPFIKDKAHPAKLMDMLAYT